MKPYSILVLLSLLFFSGIWLARQQRAEISKLETIITDLSQRIESLPKTRSASPFTTVRKTSLERKDVDWLLVAEELQSGSSRYGILKTSLKLEDQLSRLSATELKKALKAAEEGNLDDSSLKHLTLHLLRLLVVLDPAHLILNRSTDPRVSGEWSQMVFCALGNWTTLAPDEAVAWLDSQSLDGFPPRGRMRLKHTLVSALTISDFPQARERLSAISEAARHDFFDSFPTYGITWTEDDFSAQNLTGRYADLSRLLPAERRIAIVYPLTILGEKERPGAVRAIQKNLKGWRDQKHGSLSMEVFGDYLTKIEPSPAELDLCIDTVIARGRLVLPDQPEREPEELRAWLQSEFKSTLRPK